MKFYVIGMPNGTGFSIDFENPFRFVRRVRTDSIKGSLMREKRQFERFDIQVPAVVKIPGDNGNTVKLDLKTHNLSAGGTFVKLGESLSLGCEVKIDIMLSFEELKTPIDPLGSLILSTTGRVVRSDPNGVAICFNENYEFKTRLDFLHQNLDGVTPIAD